MLEVASTRSKRPGKAQHATMLLHPDHARKSLPHSVEHAAGRNLVDFSCHAFVMLGIARRPHDLLAQGKAVPQVILEEQVGSIDLLLAGCCIGRRVLDAVLKEMLKCALFWPETIDWPSTEDASVVGGEGLTVDVSSKDIAWSRTSILT